MSPSTRLVLAAAAASSCAAWVPTERFGNAPSNFDLGHTKLVFTPNSDHTDYGICTSYTAELPFAIDVADSPAVELVCVCANAGDECHQNPNAIPGVCYDDDHGVLPMTTPFPYYGRTYGEIYVNVNGQITFGTGSTDWSESLAAHLTVPGLAVFFDDLMTKHNPEINGWTNYFRSIDDAGTVYHRALTASESSAGGVVVTWMRVAGYLDAGNVGTQDVLDTNLNTFQAVLEYDGTITMAYELIALPDAIVGLSDGMGLSPFFENTDFSDCKYSTGHCGAQLPLCILLDLGAEAASKAAEAAQAAEAGEGPAPVDSGGTTSGTANRDPALLRSMSATEGLVVVSFLINMALAAGVGVLVWRSQYGLPAGAPAANDVSYVQMARDNI